jgi:hypothetical protein
VLNIGRTACNQGQPQTTNYKPQTRINGVLNIGKTACNQGQPQTTNYKPQTNIVFLQTRYGGKKQGEDHI